MNLKERKFHKCIFMWCVAVQCRVGMGQVIIFEYWHCPRMWLCACTQLFCLCDDVNSGSCAALEWKIFRGRSSWVTWMIFVGLFVLWNKTDARNVFWLPALSVDCQKRPWEGRVWGTWSLRCGCVNQHWRRKGLLFFFLFVNGCYDSAPSNQHWSIVFYAICF